MAAGFPLEEDSNQEEEMPLFSTTNVPEQLNVIHVQAINHALNPETALFGAILSPHDLLPLSNPDTVRVKKDINENVQIRIEAEEDLSVAESHIFLPKFHYQAVQSQRKRIRVNTN